jgi:hypothetical protein
MAAIIEFPRELSIWRHDRARVQNSPVGLEGNILLFTGVRYAKNKLHRHDSKMEPAKTCDDVKS